MGGISFVYVHSCDCFRRIDLNNVFFETDLNEMLQSQKLLVHYRPFNLRHRVHDMLKTGGNKDSTDMFEKQLAGRRS